MLSEIIAEEDRKGLKSNKIWENMDAFLSLKKQHSQRLLLSNGDALTPNLHV